PVANLAIRDEAPPERQGAAFGFGASSVSTAHAIGPLGAGLLAAAIGFGFPFLVPGVLLVGVAAILWFTMSGGPVKGSKPVHHPLPPHK
nr:MFS transporter [Rubrobacter sp.]